MRLHAWSSRWLKNERIDDMVVSIRKWIHVPRLECADIMCELCSAQVEELAEALEVTPTIFPGPHDMMLVSADMSSVRDVHVGSSR